MSWKCTVILLHIMFVTSFSNDQSQLVIKDILNTSFNKSHTILIIFQDTVSCVASEKILCISSNISTTQFFQLFTNWTVIVNNESNKIDPVDGAHVVKAEQTLILLRTFQREVLKKEVESWINNNPQWRGDANILIVVDNAIEILQIRAIFEELWSQSKTINVVVLTVHGKIGLFSWHPYAKSCRVDVYEIPFDRQKNIFATKKLNNLNGCSVLASTSIARPYVYAPTKGVDNFTEGVEVHIYNELANDLNFKTGFKSLPNGSSPWLIREPNGTPAGLMGQIYRHETDLAFWGVRLMLERSLIADHLPSYYSDELLWITPQPENLLPFESMFTMFSLTFWLLWLISIFLSAITVWLLIRGDFGISFLAVWAATLNTSANIHFSRNLFRIFYIIYFFSMLNIISMYQSALLGRLTGKNQVKPFSTPYEASLAGLQVHIFPSLKPEINQSDPIWKVILKNVNWTEDYLGSLRQTAFGKKTYMGSSRLSGTIYINSLYTTRTGYSPLRLMKNRLQSYDPVFYISRDHPLKPILHHKIRCFVESGLVTHWLKELKWKAIANRKLTSLVLDLEFETQISPILTVKNLIGAFSILLLFSIVASGVFLLEYFFSHCSFKGPICNRLQQVFFNIN